MIKIKNLFTISTQLDFGFSTLLLSFFILLILIASIRMIFVNNYFELIILLSASSVFISLCYLLMDAPDVSMTEVALGSCFSTCVLLGFIKKNKILSQNPLNIINEFQLKKIKFFLIFVICLSLFSFCIWVSFDLPNYGSNSANLHIIIGKYYIYQTKNQIGIPSFTSAILASYRSYDTLGETLVILISGIGSLLISSKKDNSYYV